MSVEEVVQRPDSADRLSDKTHILEPEALVDERTVKPPMMRTLLSAVVIVVVAYMITPSTLLVINSVVDPLLWRTSGAAPPAMATLETERIRPSPPTVKRLFVVASPYVPGTTPLTATEEATTPVPKEPAVILAAGISVISPLPQDSNPVPDAFRHLMITGDVENDTPDDSPHERDAAIKIIMVNMKRI